VVKVRFPGKPAPCSTSVPALRVGAKDAKLRMANMIQCVVRDWQGKEAGEASLDLKVRQECVPARRTGPSPRGGGTANARQGHGQHTHPRRGCRAVAASLYKQKGTVRARLGLHPHTTRPGGGVDLRSKPRSYAVAMNPRKSVGSPAYGPDQPAADIVRGQGFRRRLEAPKTREIGQPATPR